jgi:hypothetical protein
MKVVARTGIRPARFEFYNTFPRTRPERAKS